MSTSHRQREERDMESQLVRRRTNIIAGHFAAAPDDISGSATYIFPANCSSSLNSVIRRCDNRMHFARQGSSSQGFFMRQASKEQNCGSSLNSVIRRCDNRMQFARQGSSSQAFFMRQASIEQASSAQSGVPLNSTGSANECCSNALGAPLFSRPSRMQPNFLNAGVIPSVAQECQLPAPEPPKFARPIRRIGGQTNFCSRKKINAFESSGVEWSPRMDVAESGCSYVLMVELPGVCITDIKVEVNDQSSLIVMGKNLTQRWREASLNDTVSTYHKREISQGPYQMVWSLPRNVNKNGISAEFVDGLLRITIPKL